VCPFVREPPDATLAELWAQLRQRRGRPLRVAPMGRVLPCLGPPRTNRLFRLINATRRGARRPVPPIVSRPPRALRRVQCVEAAGLNLTMTRLYGQAPKSARHVGSLPLNSGAHITRLGALGVDGCQAVISGEGATDAAVFRSYGQQGLGPTLGRGDIVVLDNLAAHKTPGVQQALARRRVRRLYLPPDSPDLPPMERCWSQVKTALRAAKAHTREALEPAIQQAMETIPAIDA
jgi:transposase